MAAFGNCEMKSGDRLQRNGKVALGVNKISSMDEMEC